MKEGTGCTNGSADWKGGIRDKTKPMAMTATVEIIRARDARL